MKESIIDFISASVDDKPVQAIKAFSSAMEPKIQAAMDNKYTEVANQVFNSNVQTEIEDEE